MADEKEKKKITVITGGAGGLGSELAREAMSRGQHVIIIGREEKRLKAMAESLQKSASVGSVIPLVCDITNQDNVDSVAGFIKDEGYTVEYLFNNAGTGFFRKAAENRSPDVEKIIGSSLTGMILFTSAILNITPDKSPLTIVNVMSTSSLIGRATETVYCAAKWGARGFTEALRAELKGDGKKVIAVYPGGMKTSFWDNEKRDISTFMDPADVASQIATAVFDAENIWVSDITIVRP
jgi:uncharacterized protein